MSARSAPLAAVQADVADGDLEEASAGRSVTLGHVGGGRPATVPLEVYVSRVIAGEGEPNAPEATQQALAIAIRTFAIVNGRRHAREGFDLCDSTHCQVPRVATAATRRAALATAGRVLTYDGAPAEVFYSASCGGRSESASQVWPGADLPYLTSVVDDVHDDDVPWTLERSLKELQDVLKKAGFSGSRLRDLDVLTRSESGRATRISVEGLRPETIGGEAFRTAVGAASLRSTAFTIERQGDIVRFTGRGYGHGVGMCVVGAGRRARRGESVDQILAAYFPRLELRQLGAFTSGGPRQQTQVIVDPPVVPTPPSPPPSMPAPATVPNLPAPVVETPPAPAARPAAVAGSLVTVRLPATVPPVARGIEVRAARALQAVAGVLGVPASPITVELADTIDAFRARTRRPWWVAFDRQPGAIVVGPTALADGDALDWTLRTAVAEHLMASEYAGRPLWVVVGGGRYVGRAAAAVPLVPIDGSRQRPSRGSRGRDVCPTDAQLTTAASSASAQREVEGRAETCFARALAVTGVWRDVK